LSLRRLLEVLIHKVFVSFSDLFMNLVLIYSTSYECFLVQCIAI
jgi:hypothetical protein